MKKILSTLILVSLVLGLIIPSLALAQPQTPKECCNLRQEIIIGDRNTGRCAKDSIAAPNVTAANACKPGNYCYNSANSTKKWGMYCMLNTVYSATNWFFYILIILSTILILWGGFAILFATGDPEKMKKGRGIIIYAIVGIAIALFARVIPSIVSYMMGL